MALQKFSIEQMRAAWRLSFQDSAPAPASLVNPDTQRLAVPAVLLSFWFLAHPYAGIFHDALIYIGRGMANLDPAGVGADFMFAHDGQSRFSVFSFIAERCITSLGAGGAAKLLAATGLASWFAALVALAGALAQGRAKWAIVICVAALGSSYGGFGVFHYAEPLATPRIFAEAGVIAAMAALAHERRLIALAFIIAAAAFHPIMALAGAAAFYAALCFENRRWLLLGALGLAAGLLGAFLGLPLLDRLFVKIDAEWLANLHARNVYIFPTEWPSSAYEALSARSAALLIAARLAPKFCVLLWPVLIAGFGGLLVSVLLGDLLPLLLVTQAQLWRSTWLVMALGAAALPFVAMGLWKEGPASRITLGVLALASIVTETPLVFALAALAVLADRHRAQNIVPPTRLIVVGLWLFVALAAAAFAGVNAIIWLKLAQATPAGAISPYPLFVSLGVVATPLAAAAIAWAMLDRPAPREALTGAAWLLPALALFFWSNETPFQKALDFGAPPAELERIVAKRPGEVLWLGPSQQASWMWLGRPNWAAVYQASGSVFSRPLGEVWRERMQALRALDFVSDDVFRPFEKLDPVDFPDLSAEKLRRLCARPDAPAWIVAPIRSPNAAPAGAAVWRGPAMFVLRRAGDQSQWQTIEDFAVIGCAHSPA